MMIECDAWCYIIDNNDDENGKNKPFLLVHLLRCLFIQARALVPQHAETDVIRFIVGTQSLKFENQVSLNLIYHILYCALFTLAKHV